jgi:hypothetical protein
VVKPGQVGDAQIRVIGMAAIAGLGGVTGDGA